jgi:hypothetical protein
VVVVTDSIFSLKKTTGSGNTYLNTLPGWPTRAEGIETHAIGADPRACSRDQSLNGDGSPEARDLLLHPGGAGHEVDERLPQQVRNGED